MKKILINLFILSSIFMLTWCFGKKTLPENTQNNENSQTQNLPAENTTNTSNSAQTKLSSITVNGVENQEFDLEANGYTEEDDKWYVCEITWSVDGYISDINISIVWGELPEPVKYSEWDKSWSAKIKLSKEMLAKGETKISVQWIENSKGVEKPINAIVFKINMPSQKDWN